MRGQLARSARKRNETVDDQQALIVGRLRFGRLVPIGLGMSVLTLLVGEELHTYEAIELDVCAVKRRGCSTLRLTHREKEQCDGEGAGEPSQPANALCRHWMSTKAAIDGNTSLLGPKRSLVLRSTLSTR